MAFINLYEWETTMKRCALFLAIMFVLLLAGPALAQITFDYLDRCTACELDPQVGPNTFWTDGSVDPGPYFKDIEVDEGSHHMRSVHDSEIILDGANLTVTGSFLGTVSTEDQASISHVSASANLAVSFVPMDPSAVSIEVSIPVNGEAWFFDLTDADYGFDHQGPGVFTLDDTLVPGHEYVFQVFYSVAVHNEGPQQAEESVTLSMTVTPDPVAVGEVTWGSVKALFR